MSLEKCLKIISEELELDEQTSAKLYKTFWDMIEELIYKQGSVTVDGVGTFYLEQNPESSKEEYVLKFKASERLKKEIGLE
ncbi:MAG TPA: hypothetical protein PLE45_10775 [Spirochaetota bacterium]|nr:hypothetical protein [Spirochaetota bacterium]HOL57634.1 hypothetical protein [Spirochaetota bacterium]HPP05183.1 hypothetical protein [Spirochaetota bacterium]